MALVRARRSGGVVGEGRIGERRKLRMGTLASGGERLFRVTWGVGVHSMRVEQGCVVRRPLRMRGGL